jgi:hypothetical protein
MKHYKRVVRSRGTIYSNIPLINRFDYFVVGSYVITFLNGKYLEIKKR